MSDEQDRTQVAHCSSLTAHSYGGHVPARCVKPSGRSLEPRSNARPRGMAVQPRLAGGQNSAYRSGCHKFLFWITSSSTPLGSVVAMCLHTGADSRMPHRRGTWYHSRVGDSACVPIAASTVPAPVITTTVPSRHSALVRITHWITTLCFFALLVSGIEIVISHPRFYWGETGNDLTPVLFKLPIPASRNFVPTGYGYVLPDQNGWSRYLHFQSAWLLVFTGLLYAISGLLNGHFGRNLIPERSDLSGGRSRRQSSNICASNGPVRQKPGRITRCSGSPTFLSSSFCFPWSFGRAWRCLPHLFPQFRRP